MIKLKKLSFTMVKLTKHKECTMILSITQILDVTQQTRMIFNHRN